MRCTWLIALVALAACDSSQQTPPAEAAVVAPPPRSDGHIAFTVPGQPGKPRVLIYSFESYWRHYSNIDLMLAITNMSTSRGFAITSTNDPMAINAKNLAQIDVVVFAVTSGEGLDPSCQADLEAWVRAGGGIVAFHSATATEWNWPFYLDNMGTQFAGHADGLLPATVKLLSSTHPITAGLPDLQLADEWYFFTKRPETIPGMEMLLALDESTLPPEYPAQWKQGFHPIGWAHEKYGGRVFYSAFGHNSATWADPTVLEITGRAIEWAAHQR